MATTYSQVSYGSSGKDVRTLQELLKQNGYSLDVDGIFGANTQAAVRDYQKKNGLDVDGIVGNNTWGALTTPATTTPTETTTPTTPETTTQTTNWSYADFEVSDSTAEADKNRQEVASQKPGDFTYGEYEKSDVVKQAEAMLKQQLSQKPGAYQSAWQTQLDETLNKILNREKFTYDLNGDALYQQYKDQYMLQGQQAMMDTMGQAAALTGGYGNSYAQTAGQQTYQGYLQQLNDKVPELYQLALDQYNREGEELYNQYGLFADMDDRDYGRYRDSVSDYYTDRDYYTDEARYQSEQDYSRWADDRNFAYGQYRDSVSDWQFDLNRADEDYWNQYNRDYGQYTDDRNLSYQQNRDQVSDSQWEQTFQYQKDRDAKSDEQWQAEFDEAKRQYDQAYALENGGSSGGNTGGNTDGNTGGNYDANTAQIQQQLKDAGYDIAVDGIWGSETQAAYDDYNGNDGGDSGFTGSTYSEAVAYMKANGVEGAANVMTKEEWNRRKSSYQTTGKGSNEVIYNGTYEEYLQSYVEYKLNPNG